MKQNNIQKLSTVDLIINAMKEARIERGFSHDYIASKTGLHRSAISLIESRKREPTLLTCLKIAHALEINLGEIILEAQAEK